MRTQPPGTAASQHCQGPNVPTTGPFLTARPAAGWAGEGRSARGYHESPVNPSPPPTFTQAPSPPAPRSPHQAPRPPPCVHPPSPQPPARARPCTSVRLGRLSDGSIHSRVGTLPASSSSPLTCLCGKCEGSSPRCYRLAHHPELLYSSRSPPCPRAPHPCFWVLVLLGSEARSAV